jgi:DNA-binding NtrC family response regulator
MASEISRVLVVDDDPNLTDLLVDTLSAIGYEPHSAGSAQEALRILSSTHIDLVISDINMPEMSGIELLQEIKKLNRRLPVMLITGIGSDGIRAQAYSKGADGFLAKPFRIGTMESEIGKMLLSLRKRRIVVIDDNQEFLSSLCQRLEERDNEVHAFSNIKDSTEFLSYNPVDLVITDLKMPDGDGLSLIDQLHSRFPNLPVIMISAYATDELLERIRKSGVQKFMPKPLDFSELEIVVKACADIKD